MDHMTMTGSMDHSMGMGTPTGTAAMASSTAGGMGGMDHEMGMAGGCKISMLWNWNTVDSCFISESWHIKSTGMFAGSCIGVILLVLALEFLRRAGKEYDRYILSQYTSSLSSSSSSSSSSAAPLSSSSSHDNTTNDNGKGASATETAAACAPVHPFRPSVLQQAVRALLHMAQFAVAYFVMLLAMYYNGYFIICIFIGAFLGYFIFGWESLKVGGGGRDRLEPNATVCCG